MKLSKEIKEHRTPNYEIEPLILSRWSPRAFSGEALSDAELMPLFEAARWAPSSYNNQPWRFLYAKRDTKNWDLFFNLLGDWNKQWCKNAAALVVVVAKKVFDYNGKPSVSHAFDTGAAWENLALQATASGLVAHGMEGFDYERAKKDLAVPDDCVVLAMVAIGKRGKAELLPEDIRKTEMPNTRRPLSEIAIEGKFKLVKGK